jgi:hypothetical protein
MQRPIEYNQGFMNFDLPKYELMTPDQFEKYVKQSFNLESQSEEESQPQPQPQLPRNLFGQIKLQNQPPTHLSQITQPTHPTNLTQSNQQIRPACLGAIGPNQPNISFGEALSNLKKTQEKKDTEKGKQEIIEALCVELSAIRSQIEFLTKATDNIYRIITKL